MIDPRKIWSSSQLPTLPTVAMKLLELSRNPETELREIVSLIKTDPAISAKLLKAANSTFFGFSSKITSVDRAVPLLGTTMVTSLTLSFSVVDAAVTKGLLAEHYRNYWLQSVVHAASAEYLAEKLPGGQPCEHLLTGLLMDIGRLAMLKTIPGPYQAVLDEWRQAESEPLHVVESRSLGFDHLTIGAELMRHWNLPEALRTATRLHHAPLSELREVTSGDAPLVQSAAIAAALGDYFCTNAKGVALERLRELAGHFLGLRDEALNQELLTLKSRIDAAGEVFAIDTAELPDTADLMAQANEQLAQLAMREHVAGTQATARQLAVEQEQRVLRVQNEQLMHQTLHDPLTKVYNRVFFDETLNKEVVRCCRTAESLGVIFVDVDRFKQINDSYGHQFGDCVLKRVAECMSETLRSCDLLARYGGEEFVVLATQATEKGIEKVAHRLRARIETEDFRYGSQRVPVTASFGASLTIPGPRDHELGPRLIAAADEAMYQAKQAGRNCVRVRPVLRDFDRRLVPLVLQNRFSRWLVSRGAVDVESVSRVVLKIERQRVKIGELARRLGYLEDHQVRQILSEQEASNTRFGEVAVKLGLLSEAEVASLLAVQQEDPRDLAERLATAGVLEASLVQALCDEYLESHCPALAEAS